MIFSSYELVFGFYISIGWWRPKSSFKKLQPVLTWINSDHHLLTSPNVSMSDGGAEMAPDIYYKSENIKTIVIVNVNEKCDFLYDSTLSDALLKMYMERETVFRQNSRANKDGLKLCCTGSGLSIQSIYLRYARCLRSWLWCSNVMYKVIELCPKLKGVVENIFNRIGFIATLSSLKKQGLRCRTPIDVHKSFTQRPNWLHLQALETSWPYQYFFLSLQH